MRLPGLLLTCGLFGAAFGVIEGAVVVYLRALYYPDGFAFPLKDIPTGMLRMELVRELATIVLLVTVAWLAAQRPVRRFAVFAYCFAVWDLVYYLTLKLVLDWPAGLLEWDVLFLIPLPWIGPVLAPMLVSVVLIGASVALLLTSRDARRTTLRPVDWVIEVLAGLAIVASFLSNTNAIAGGAPPAAYPWWLFGLGLSGGLAWFWWRMSRPRG